MSSPKHKPFIRECAFWSERRSGTKGCPKHTFETADLSKEYCTVQHKRAATAQRRSDRIYNDGIVYEHLLAPKLRRQAKVKPPIVGSTKYPDEELGRVKVMNAPAAQRCPRCGNWVYGECGSCEERWF